MHVEVTVFETCEQPVDGKILSLRKLITFCQTTLRHIKEWTIMKCFCCAWTQTS